MFKYGDEVKVVNGFYEGLEGILVDIDEDNHPGYAHYYDIEILFKLHSNKKVVIKLIKVYSHNIEKINKV